MKIYDYTISILDVLLAKYKAITGEKVTLKNVFIVMLANYYRPVDILSVAKDLHKSHVTKYPVPHVVNNRIKTSAALLNLKEEQYIGAVTMLWLGNRGIKNPTMPG